MLGLNVKTSTLENAGLGLFTTKPRREGEYICPYLGRIVLSTDFEMAPDDYSVEIDRERVLSARFSSDGFGRFANDGRSNAANSCSLMTEATYEREYMAVSRTGREETAVCLVEQRDIQPGAELFVSYGQRAYWARKR